MRSVSTRKYPSFIILTLLICFESNFVFSQTDSLSYYQDLLVKTSTIEKKAQVVKSIEYYLLKSTNRTFLEDANALLITSQKSEYSNHIFYLAFKSLEKISKDKKLETDFSIFAIRLESNENFQNEDIKNQLFYYYAQLYFKIKEFYYAEKYCNLYLKNKRNSFLENIQADCDINAMTISALIDEEKNNYDAAFAKLQTTLDSSIAKKREAWIGITKGNIAYLLYQKGNYEQAIPYLKEDIRLSVQYNELASAINSLLTLKDIYLQLKQPQLAYPLLDSAHTLLKHLLDINPDNYKDLLVEAFQIHTALAQKYFDEKNYEKASEFYNRAYHINVSKEQEEKANQIKRIIESIEINQSINKINELHEEVKTKKEALYLFLIITVSILGILMVFIVYYRKIKKVNKSLLIKSEIIKHQNIVLESINNDKDRLFSIISHDLRGPSNNLHLLFKAVADKKLPVSTLEDQLPNIVKNSTNLINTLESLLTWSVSQLKGIVANKERIDIIDPINTNIHFFEDQAQKKSINLLNHCHSKMVLIDKDHIEIILRNLTSNAIKFSKQNSSIIFDQIEHADHVEILVVDEGTGLTDEQINNIMNSNAQKSVVGTSGEKGIGLGLLLTKEFIEINGGVLKIKSRMNEGTTMSFTIPKAL